MWMGFWWPHGMQRQNHAAEEIALNDLDLLEILAPRAGFEPATIRLTVECSTAELPRNRRNRGFATGSV